MTAKSGHGFTLVELIVVIGVIVLLLGVTLSVGTTVIANFWDVGVIVPECWSRKLPLRPWRAPVTLSMAT